MEDIIVITTMIIITTTDALGVAHLQLIVSGVSVNAIEAMRKDLADVNEIGQINQVVPLTLIHLSIVWIPQHVRDWI